MARDSSGAKNQPQYAGTGAPADSADLSEIANYAAQVGNRKAGPTTHTTPSLGRTTSTGADVWEGLEWEDTTDGFTYKYRSGAWVRTFDDTGWVTLSYAPNWSDFSSGYPALSVRRKNGVAFLSAMGKTSAGVGAGTLITTVPAGYRIGRQEVRVTIGSGGPCSLEIFADGSVRAGPSGVYAGWTSLSVSWIADN